MRRRYFAKLSKTEAKYNRVLYTGVTNNLQRRIFEHENKLVKGFSSKYNLFKLLYFEQTTDVYSAIAREKEIKGWIRKKKVELIRGMNPDWEDLRKNI